ncbi:MAG TPA: DUF1684 domain-containing protein [Gaiellales bacterium]|nr:DUF1684 domain-containing protein [Gaiellales bacterium]
MTAGVTTIGELELADWRREIFALYARVRGCEDSAAAWEMWRRTRDRLFAEHPQSPLDAAGRAAFAGLPYHPYDPDLRVTADVDEMEPVELELATSTGEPYRFRRFGAARFALSGIGLELSLYWLEGYGGGLFLPFADRTSGRSTHGAGRYLLDTVKGADLGTADGRLVLDFNFAYNPSCVYDPAWTCPLAPAANRLAVAVRAGERADG